MVDILNRVGPPQAAGLRDDRTKQDVFGAKTDFQDHLKQQMTKSGKKENDRPDTERFRAKIQADSSGGIKKKMMKPESDKKEDQVQEEDLNKNVKEKKVKADTDSLNFDPNMVLMLMASNENDIKTADSEESLQSVENQIESSKLLLESSQADQALTQESKKNLELGLSLSVEHTEVLPQLNLEDQSMFKADDSLQTEVFVENDSALAQQVDNKKSIEFDQSSVSENKDLETLSKDGQVDKLNFQSRVMQTLKQDNNFPSQISQTTEKPISLKEDFLNMKTEVKNQELGPMTHSIQSVDQVAKESTSDKNFSQSGSGDSQNDFDSKSFDANLQSHHVGVGHAFSTKLDQANVSQGVAVATNVNSSQRAEEVRAVQDIMNQANFLVTKGGGEVTLKLDSLNGAGDVQLKVMMENGRINVELNTQDRSVKKLIEDSLSDLKSSLASHQMSLEHVKINNVVAGVNTENQSQQLQQDHGGSSNQFGELQQHMQQQSQKQRAFETAKQWTSATGLNFDKPVEMPLQNLRQSAASRYYGLNKGNSLNAVG